MAKKIKAVGAAPEVDETEFDESEEGALDTGAEDALSVPESSEDDPEVENDLPQGGALRVTNIGHLNERSRTLGEGDDHKEYIFPARVPKKIPIEKLKAGDVKHLIADDHLKVEHVDHGGPAIVLSTGGKKAGTLPAKAKTV